MLDQLLAVFSVAFCLRGSMLKSQNKIVQPC